MCFEGCSSLSSINIGNSVKIIGVQCFDGCSGLSSISIPNSVEIIGDCCFAGCSSLESITVGDKTYSTLEELKAIHIHIGNDCFNKCLLFNKEAVIPQTDVPNEMPQQ
jgi:hypothetical protein